LNAIDKMLYYMNKEIRAPEKNHRPAQNQWRNLSHLFVQSTSRHGRD